MPALPSPSRSANRLPGAQVEEVQPLDRHGQLEQRSRRSTRPRISAFGSPWARSGNARFAQLAAKFAAGDQG